MTTSEQFRAQVVERVCQAVASQPQGRWSSARLASVAGATPVQLQRAFRALLGMSPRDFVTASKRRRFLDTLKAQPNVTDAIYDSGYGSPSRVYEAIRLPGMTPATYGRGGRGAHIRWKTSDSPVGRIMVAATDRGLCFVQVGRGDAALLSQLREEFPLATIDARPSASLAPLAGAACAIAELKPLPPELPVDIRGTAFQWRVWRALTRIPRGETRSYADLAKEVGLPKAVRAVARACATNPLALVVPCHRVIGSNGSLTGYRWGLEVKQTLLERERGAGRGGRRVRSATTSAAGASQGSTPERPVVSPAGASGRSAHRPLSR
jgi:AraC family transcriptional regulator, regulatory protein of adaptative response / methylated-DNA-[protein]-cysteine methyltransferase